ncbi:MAG: BMC domain-containing protein [Defluviitaleaceae bacterium]|nr:BMC domain-containing protein [Defluviitaleaceae bacterium]
MPNHEHQKLTLSKAPPRRALAMVEFSTVSSGIKALDIITKAAEVDILAAQTICPGKYMILFCGGLGAVNASLAATRHVPGLIDEFLLGRPHSSIFAAINGSKTIPGKAALGLIETLSGAAAIKAADTAAKSAWVNLIEIRIAHGMCGKSTVMFTGETAAVSAALEAAKKEAAENGMLLDTVLIPNPDEKMLAALNLR